jgi:hypothetical protein
MPGSYAFNSEISIPSDLNLQGWVGISGDPVNAGFQRDPSIMPLFDIEERIPCHSLYHKEDLTKNGFKGEVWSLDDYAQIYYGYFGVPSNDLGIPFRVKYKDTGIDRVALINDLLNNAIVLGADGQSLGMPFKKHEPSEGLDLTTPRLMPCRPVAFAHYVNIASRIAVESNWYSDAEMTQTVPLYRCAETMYVIKCREGESDQYLDDPAHKWERYGYFQFISVVDSDKYNKLLAPLKVKTI